MEMINSINESTSDIRSSENIPHRYAPCHPDQSSVKRHKGMMDSEDTRSRAERELREGSNIVRIERNLSPEGHVHEWLGGSEMEEVLHDHRAERMKDSHERPKVVENDRVRLRATRRGAERQGLRAARDEVGEKREELLTSVVLPALFGLEPLFLMARYPEFPESEIQNQITPKLGREVFS
ncbi:hypothetical protein DFH09DRAFT_1110920 [Mycena vulgaris]|nr:hypothetical protein DFH09DRAFT_1110920 [Mycena vulgaris]